MKKIMFMLVFLASIITGTIYANNILYSSKEISYDNSNTRLESTNVSNVVDELYNLCLDNNVSIEKSEIETIYEANKIKYDNTKSVQEAINEIYERCATYNLHESILNGTDPVLKDGLIPVVIEDNGTVKYAKPTDEWYNYNKKRWANAVILKSGEFKRGDTIPESAIESYFVWIPRYKYQLFYEDNYASVINSKPTISNAKEIQIVFENKNTTPSNGSTKGSWLTHPAFTNFDTNGMWVGKFETTGTTSAITVKPGLSSLKNINVATMFNVSYNYKRDLDSHMMKNTEWGAVAYLSHSKYGINKEVNINNNSAYLTGYSAADGTDQSYYKGTYGTDASITQPYNTTTGYKTSTTGNISGIYDMSGGTHEYVAGHTNNTLGSSGLTSDEVTTTYKKYFDVYNESSSITSYNNRILGDATGELGPIYKYVEKDGLSYYHNSWYADQSNFVDSSNPWFYRGGNYDYGVLAGLFGFVRDIGEGRPSIGFRLVLSIN